MPTQTDPSRAGLSTSEGKLAVAAFIMGMLLEGSIVPMLQSLQAAHPEYAWVAPALGGAGLLLQLASLLGYTSSRTRLKLAILAQDAPATIIQAPDVVRHATSGEPAAVAEAIRQAVGESAGVDHPPA